MNQRIFGITGWKNSGKTTLTERLVTHLTGLGLTVSTIKHAHHDTEIDHPGRDSHRHRVAGAAQVIVSSPHRWALMTELRSAREPRIEDLVARLDPVDLVLVEGYKRAPHPKVECHRVATETNRGLVASSNPTIRLVASDGAPVSPVPVIALDDIAGIAAFIMAEVGL